MANRKANVKQADLARYLAAFKKAGVTVDKMTVSPNGTVTIWAAEEVPNDRPNPCDRLLD